MKILYYTPRLTKEVICGFHWSGTVNQFNVWKRGIEYSVFFRRDLVLKIGELDESLGPGSGSPCWAGEITDYMLRALNKGILQGWKAEV
jgi:hypothetical protein